MRNKFFFLTGYPFCKPAICNCLMILVLYICFGKYKSLSLLPVLVLRARTNTDRQTDRQTLLKTPQTRRNDAVTGQSHGLGIQYNQILFVKYQPLYRPLSVLWRCWLGGRKGIRPVKNWVVGCWRGYLSGARCRLAYGPADATATHLLLLQ